MIAAILAIQAAIQGALAGGSTIVDVMRVIMAAFDQRAAAPLCQQFTNYGSAPSPYLIGVPSGCRAPAIGELWTGTVADLSGKNWPANIDSQSCLSWSVPGRPFKALTPSTQSLCPVEIAPDGSVLQLKQWTGLTLR